MKWSKNNGKLRPGSNFARRAGWGGAQIILAAWLALALLLPVGAQAAHADPPMPISPAGAVALVRIDLAGPADLARLAGRGLKFYAQVALEAGRIMLLLPAEAGQQTALAQLGYAVQVLDGDVQGAVYYLLYGSPQTLAQAETPLLLVEGRYGLARATPEQTGRLIQLGLRVTQLIAQPLASASTPAAAPGRPAKTANPVVQGMIDQVSRPALNAALQSLTGESDISVEGSVYRLTTRYSLSPTPIRKTTQYAYDVFRELGLKTVFDPYANPDKVALRNVVAEQTGLTQPQRIFLLTAHIDSTSNLNPYQTAPGADDNASGAAAVMQAARILSQYDFGCTVRYVLFTGEEQGLHGSAAYAGDVKRLGENVEAVLNLDMLAYNTPDSTPTMELHTRPGNAGDLAIANQFIEVVQTYALDLTPLLLADSMGDSDHASFWYRGYPATIAIEDWSDHTPYYHRTNDRISSLNLPYYGEMVKASVATMGHLGCLLDGQIRGAVHSQADNRLLPGVQVEAWQDGRRVEATASDSGGTYRLPLLAGMYILKAFAPGYRTVNLEAPAVSLGQESQQDFLLEPCETVQSPDFEFLPADLKPGQEVSLSARVASGQPPVRYTWSFGDQTSAEGPAVTHVFPSPGLYPVVLTADNDCGYPQTHTRNLAVGLNVLYLPVLWK